MISLPKIIDFSLINFLFPMPWGSAASSPHLKTYRRIGITAAQCTEILSEVFIFKYPFLNKPKAFLTHWRPWWISNWLNLIISVPQTFNFFRKDYLNSGTLSENIIGLWHMHYCEGAGLTSLNLSLCLLGKLDVFAHLENGMYILMSNF